MYLRTYSDFIILLTFPDPGDIIPIHLFIPKRNHLRGRVKFPTGGKAREHPQVQDPVTQESSVNSVADGIVRIGEGDPDQVSESVRWLSLGPHRPIMI